MLLYETHPGAWSVFTWFTSAWKKILLHAFKRLLNSDRGKHEASSEDLNLFMLQRNIHVTETTKFALSNNVYSLDPFVKFFSFYSHRIKQSKRG